MPTSEGIDETPPSSGPGPGPPVRPVGLAAIGGVVVFVLALAALHVQLADAGYEEIASALGALPASGIVYALGLTLASLTVLSGIEALSVRYAGRSIGYPRVALASFVGFGFSQALGSPLFTGAPVRRRLYSTWGLSADDIVRIVAFYAVTGIVGLLAAAGAALVVLPGGLPAGSPLSSGVLRGIGALLLGALAGYVVRATTAREPIRVFAWELPLPAVGSILGQVALGVTDFLAGAAVLYVLLPAGHELPFPYFAGIYGLALAAGQISSVPAGLAVFEAALLLLLPEGLGAGSVLASAVAYRGIYHLLPLLLASTTLAAYEVGERRAAIERTVDAFGRGVSHVAPLALSTLVFVAGAVMVATGAVPLPESRLGWLARLLPLPLVELTHFMGSVVGVGLLVLAWGLRQRLAAAYRITLLLLALGALLSAARGLGWMESAGLLFTAGVLVSVRREFFRKASLFADPLSPRWAALVAMTVAGSVWLGLFAYRRVDLTAELWWSFTLRGDAPRFLRATVGVMVVLVAYGLWRLLSPRVGGGAADLDGGWPPEVDAVVERSGRAHAALVYLGDKKVLLSESGRAFLMYAVEGRSWISLGDPVGDREDYDELIWRFRQLAHRHGGWPVFYQARPDSLPLYADVGLGAVKLGEEAYVSLGGFTLEGGARKGLRRTVRKAEEEGVTFEILSGADVERLLPELRSISDAWLEAKKSGEKGFSLGFFREEYLRRGPVAVLRAPDGEVVSFANVLASGSRGELSADLMRYRPGAPPSAMEYLFVRLMLWGREQGYERFGLGMAPLAGLETRPLAPLWNRVGAAVFQYGEHFYNFRGLRAYKEKFDPIWEPRYLVSPGGLAFPRILTNLATLIGGGVRSILTR